MHHDEPVCLSGTLCAPPRGRGTCVIARAVDRCRLASRSALVAIVTLLVGSTLIGCGADPLNAVKSGREANAKVTPPFSDPPNTQAFEAGRLLVKFRMEHEDEVPQLPAAIPHAAKNNALSNVWKLWVMRKLKAARCSVLTRSKHASMAF